MQTKTILREHKAINDIQEAQGTGELSGSSFRAISKIITTTENMELMHTVLCYHPTTWLALRRTDIPITIIMEAFQEANAPARGAMLMSKYGASIYTQGREGELSPFECAMLLKGNKSKELHERMKAELWDIINMKPVFTFSVFNQSSEMVEIAREVKNMTHSDAMSMMGMSVSELYRSILNHDSTDSNTIAKLFDLKSYDMDRQLMLHHKTSQELKDKIAQIMKEYRGAGK